jgi:hypothetical protein
VPTILTPTGSYGTDNVSVPVDGDPRNAGSIQPAFQSLLDKTSATKARLDAGVNKVRTVADLTTLKGLTGMATGEHAVVKNLGLYEFDSGSALTVAEPVIVQPTVGGGRWLHVNRSTGVANGFATLDATAKVPAAQLRGQIVAYNIPFVASTGTLTSGSPVTLSGAVAVIAGAVAGDVLLASGAYNITNPTAGNYFKLQYIVTKGDDTPITTIAQALVLNHPSGVTPVANLTGGYIFQASDLVSGSPKVKMQADGTTGTTATTGQFANTICVSHYRGP